EGVAAGGAELVDDLVQDLLVAARQHHLGAPAGRQAGGGQADAAAGAGDDNDLVMQFFQTDFHEGLLCLKRGGPGGDVVAGPRQGSECRSSASMRRCSSMGTWRASRRRNEP